MASELPYFRFEVQPYQNGKVAIENYNLQGLFISICAYYWSNDCSITLATLKKKYKDAISEIDELINLTILKHDQDCDFIKIIFLDDQFDVLSEKRKNKQIAGSKGGKQKSSNAKAKSKQTPSYKKRKEDIIVDNKIEENIQYPFDSEEFKKWWDIWIKYKKEQHKESYKSDLTQQGALKKLNELAGGKEEAAIKIIEQSISSMWKGFFPLKNNQNDKSNQTNRAEKFTDYFNQKGRES